MGEAFDTEIDWPTWTHGGYFVGRHMSDCTDDRRHNMDVFCTQWYNRVLSPSEIKTAMRCPWANFPRPVAHILLDDIHALSDVSGNNYDATNSALVAQGDSRKEYLVVGTGSFMKLPSTATENVWPNSPFSVTFHAQVDSLPATVLQLKSPSSSVVYWKLVLDATTCTIHVRTTGAAFQEYSFTDLSPYARTSIYYRAFTWDPLTRRLSYFLQGVEMGITLVTVDLDMSSSDAEIIFGNFNGLAGNIQIFHSTLAPKHVTLLGTHPMTICKFA